MCCKDHTSVDNIVVVKVIYSFKDLFDGSSRILFCKLALLTDSVEELSSGS